MLPPRTEKRKGHTAGDDQLAACCEELKGTCVLAKKDSNAK
jgi:hypothetical protein